MTGRDYLHVTSIAVVDTSFTELRTLATAAVVQEKISPYQPYGSSFTELRTLATAAVFQEKISPYQQELSGFIVSRLAQNV